MSSSTTPQATPSEFFLINVVHVNEPKLQDLALEVLRSAVGHVARNYSAFQWSRLYKSLPATAGSRRRAPGSFISTR